MKKKGLNKKILAAFACLLCLLVSVGMTVAYFSDYEDASGGATMHLQGRTELGEGSDRANKHIVIQNTGDMNMIVRVSITGSEKYMTISHENGDETAWAKINGFYYYKKVLQPGEETPQIDALLNAKWKGQEPEYDFQVIVNHESAPAVYNGETLVTPEGWDDISDVIAPAPLPGEGE